MTTKEDFLAWKDQGYNWVPVISELLGDLHTPLSLYLKLANGPYTYLLESGFNGEFWGRYSYIGLTSHTRILVKDQVITHVQPGSVVDFFSDDPLAYIERLITAYNVPALDNDLRFLGGFVGYFGYDTIRYIEPRLSHSAQQDPLNLPDIYLLLSDQLVVYDNLFDKLYVIVYVDPTQEEAYLQATQKIAAIKKQIHSNLTSFPSPSRQREDQFSSNISQQDFAAKVEQAREYFKAGDAMQLILSQRFSKPFSEHPLQLYRTLRHVNPSPYMYYFHLEDFYIVGASPEILVRLEQGRVTVRPLAGTRRRGKTPEEDKCLEKELLADTKEIAEHLMLIDLGRNDLGRICQVGSITVREQMAVERFSHVMHISSTVEGILSPGKSLLDVLKATFPAGTVSGAPKIRAMQIIDELERDKRGVYGGAVGYLGWNGNSDMAIALRTAIIKNNWIHVQAGAGLVADSVPANEWQECLNKGKALFLATELTEQNFLELTELTL